MIPLISPTEWQPVGVDSLEPAAWAVVHSKSHSVVTAGPGAGKTELLAQRACYLLQTGQSKSPKRLLALSFKRDSATNLGDRVRERCGSELAGRFDSYTFDAFAKGLMDRFRNGLPEDWRPSPDYIMVSTPRNTEISIFLQEAESQYGAAAASTGIPSAAAFMKRYVLGVPIQSGPPDLSDFGRVAASKWWGDSLEGVDGESRLTFPMLERLVELLLRTNPALLEALQATYSHVFLDEFQDTTGAQYDLAVTAFLDSSTILTAVGDKKQQIMRWAGAIDDIFERFESDFDATRSPLVSNYRSSPELVKIQHTLAQAIDEGYVQVESKAPTEFEDAPCEIREYAEPEMEAQDIANLIDASLKQRGLRSRDIAILVRQKAPDYEPLIAAALEQRGIKLRVELELQDLLAERLTQVVLPFLRLGSVARSAEYWARCSEICVDMWRVGSEAGGYAVSDRLDRFHRRLRQTMQDADENKDKTKRLVDMVLDFLGRDNVVTLFGEYARGTFRDETEERLAHYLAKSCQGSENWVAALDDFEGVDIVPIMTVHKSKGLEYDTVIFVGLDDQAWWSFRKQPEEGVSTFFVAFSRAKQRVLFTYCESRGGRSDVASLYGLLTDAGVQSRQIQ